MRDDRLAECAACAARDLVELAFRCKWPEIPHGQPERLLVVALSQAAVGVEVGETLANALVAEESPPPSGERLDAFLWRFR